MAVQQAAETIKVHGLTELRRALDQAADRMPEGIAAANLKAAEVVAADARLRAPKGPHQGGGTIVPIFASIQAISTARRGYVAFGGRLSPHAPVYEFGGSIPRRGTRATHGALIRTARKKHLGFGFVGVPVTDIRKRAYVYPAIAAKADEVLRTYGAAVEAVLRDRNL